MASQGQHHEAKCKEAVLEKQEDENFVEESKEEDYEDIVSNVSMIRTNAKCDSNVRMHDFFNLLALVPIVLLNVVNWDWNSILSGQASVHLLWTGQYFEIFWWSTCVYFVIDLLWVAIIPTSVKSPKVIIGHHLLVLMYIMVPRLYPKTRWCMGACMSVELNTWFLIARRYLKHGIDPRCKEDSPRNADGMKSESAWLRIGFYCTWIIIRLILYPLLVVVICWEYILGSYAIGTFVNIIMFAPFIQAILVILNLKWSWDLFGCGARRKNEKGPQKEGL